MITVTARRGTPIPLGRRGEHLARRIVFDISEWVEAFGPGVARLHHQRQEDRYPYPVTTRRAASDGTAAPDAASADEEAAINERGPLVYWDVTAADTEQVCRYGRAELRYYAGDALVKSAVYETAVLDALGPASAEAPEAGMDWVDALLSAAAAAETKANEIAASTNRAEASARSAAASAETCTSAAADAAASASAAQSASAGASAAYEHTRDLSVSAVTLDAGADARVTKQESGTGAVNLEFGLPRGTQGPAGPQGVSVTGVTQQETSTVSGGTNSFTVYLSNGSSSTFTVKNGAQGEHGEPFTIARTYPTIAAMNADFANTAVRTGAFVVIASDTEDPDNAKLYLKAETGFVFITDLSGAQGVQGEPGEAGTGIADVTNASDANGNIVVTITLTDGAHNTFLVPKGAKGDTGPRGESAAVDATLSVTGSAADAKAVGDALVLKADAAALNPSVTASGASVTFAAAGAYPLNPLTVQIEPVQSGSGDPYPPGGGKNLLAITASTSTDNGITYTVDAAKGTVRASGTASANSRLILNAADYGEGKVITGCPAGGSLSTWFLNVAGLGSDTGSGFSFDTGGSPRIISIYVVQGTTVNDLLFTPMIRASGTDPTFAPYANIRPISGVSSVSVTRTGKNLWGGQGFLNSFLSHVSEPCISVVGDAVSIAAGNMPAEGIAVFFFAAHPGAQYSLILAGSNNSEGREYIGNLRFLYSDGTASPTCRCSTDGYSNVSAAGKTVAGIQTVKNAGTATLAASKCGLFEGTATVSAFEPYRGQSVMVPLVDSNGDTLTVYGGALDVARGVLTVTHGEIAAYAGETLPGEWISDRDVYSAGAAPSTGAQVVYRLTAPVTHQLPPAQISALVGSNTVFADCGPMSVTYRPGAASPVLTLADAGAAGGVPSWEQYAALLARVEALEG